jgi:uncharacterized membrane protein
MSIIVRRVGFKQEGYTNIYVGRKSSYKLEYGLDGSYFGNPFIMPTESQRKVVCSMYETYFYGLLTHSKTKAALERLRERHSKGENFALLCFCYPRKCHADTIKQYLERS